MSWKTKLLAKNKEKEEKDKEKDVNKTPTSPRTSSVLRESKKIDIDEGEPMPSEQVVQVRFAEIAKALSIPPNVQMDIQHKWQLVKQYEAQQKQSGGTPNEETVDGVLKNLNKGRKHIKPAHMIKVRTLLSTMPTTWVKEFLNQGGVDAIVNLFRETVEQNPTPVGDAGEIIFECVRSLKAIMNVDFERIVASVDSIPLLVKYITHLNPLTKIEIFEFLAVICFKFPAGYQKIFDAIKNKGWSILVEPFVLTNDELRVATLLFINALLYGTADMDNQAQIIGGLEANGFRSLFTAANKNLQGNTDWQSQVKLFSEFEEKYEDTQEGKETKYLHKIQALEEEIKSLSIRNAHLAEALDAKSFSPGILSSPQGPSTPTTMRKTSESDSAIMKLKENIEQFQKQLKEKDEIIYKLEEKVRNIPASSIPSTASGGIPPPPGPPPQPPSSPGPGGPPPPPPGAAGGAPPPPPPPGAGGAPPPPPPPPGGGPPPPPPPPPPGGGPPPPPPPPGAPGAPAGPVLPEKKKIKPGMKMRGFMWQKLPNVKCVGTYWEKAEDEKIRLDIKHIENLFGIDESEKKKVGLPPAEATLAASQKNLTVSLLDPKRSNNLEIMLRGLKMNHIEVKKAIENMDIQALSDDHAVAVQKLLAIKSNVPTPEELKILDEYDGDKSELGNAEKYFIAIGKIPLLIIRVNSMEFKISFESKFKDIEENLDNVLKALDVVKSKPFLKLMDLVLAIGNYLNGGTNRGQTYGFKMSSLLLMSDVKSPSNPQITLTHYFSELLEKDHSDLLTCLRGFGPIHESSYQSLNDIGAQLGQLNIGIKPILTQLESATCDAVYKKAMATWAPSAAKSLESVTSKNTRAMERFKEALNFFGEPATIKSDEFFGTLSSWANGVEQAVITNEKRRAAAAKPAPTIMISKKPAGATDAKQPDSPGEFDSIVKQLKNGSLLRKESVLTSQSAAITPSKKKR